MIVVFANNHCSEFRVSVAAAWLRAPSPSMKTHTPHNTERFLPKFICSVFWLQTFIVHSIHRFQVRFRISACVCEYELSMWMWIFRRRRKTIIALHASWLSRSYYYNKLCGRVNGLTEVILMIIMIMIIENVFCLFSSFYAYAMHAGFPKWQKIMVSCWALWYFHS